MNRQGVTASFHTNEPARTQTSISVKLKMQFRTTCIHTVLTIVNVNTLNYQRVVN